MIDYGSSGQISQSAFCVQFLDAEIQKMRHECTPLPPGRACSQAIAEATVLSYYSRRRFQLCQGFWRFSNAVIAFVNNTSVIDVNGMMHAWLITLEHFEWHLQVSLMAIPTSLVGSISVIEPTSLAVSREHGSVLKFYC